MDFGFLEAAAGLDVGNFAVSLTPVPDRDRDASENEMRGVARNLGSAGLINVAKMQSRHSCEQKKCDWAVKAIGLKARRLATHPRRSVEPRVRLWRSQPANRLFKAANLRPLHVVESLVAED